jgi:ribosomal-protein-alanine N-acetyltransferase
LNIGFDYLKMKIPTLDSGRLILREYSSSDLETFITILSNRNNLRYLPSTEPWPIETVEKWLLSSQSHWLDEGFGWWILEHKIDEKPIGWCGLRRLESTGEVEVLYLIEERYWGQGLATEGAKISIEYGFNSVGLEEIIGLVLEGNIASKRVLENSGLCFQERAEYFKIECLKYWIDTTRFDEVYSSA